MTAPANLDISLALNALRASNNAADKKKADDLELSLNLLRYADDPLGFVLDCFPWGEGELSKDAGPDDWQRKLLEDIGREVKAREFNGSDPVAPLRFSVASGHGIGKSVMMAWLACWIVSTRPGSQGTVTANTYTQLETKTWPAIQRWMKLCVTRDWFVVGGSGLYHKDFKEQWFLNCQSCREENSEAFAGQHAKSSTSYYLFDEASAVPDAIWKVAEGGLTDGEAMLFAFGNPTRNSGQFYEVTFGRLRHRWNYRSIDSRTCKFPNKQQIDEWLQDYGEDSDFFRVRVRGMAPNASEDQLIPRNLVQDARRREIGEPSEDEPLIAGVDVPDGGSAWFIVRFRRGLSARPGPLVPAPIRMPGSRVDRASMIATCSRLLRERLPSKRIAMMFVDSAFGAPIVERLHTLGFDNVVEVNFGGRSPDPHFENMRAFMWGKELKDWLARGALDTADDKLEIDLTSPGFHFNKRNAVVLESKQDMAKRGVPSPDDGDALCFVAGTLIETTSGPVPIERVRLGDMVITPFGPSPVMVRHESDTMSLTTAEFSSGARLVGKREHKIFTFSRGKQRLDALALTDEVDVFSPWRLLLWRAVKACSIGASGFGFKQAVDTFNPGAKIPRRDFCTAAFGQTTLGRFLKALRFITKTRTGGTMPSAIWNYATAEATSGSTCCGSPQTRQSGLSGWPVWSADGKVPLLGTDRRRAGAGTPSTASGHGKADSRSVPLVRDAGQITKPSSLPELGTAHRPASNQSLSAATSRRRARVLSAAKSLWRTVTGTRPIVPVSVRTENVPPTRTYNLTLREHNAYYANGILVFNCLTFAQPVAPEVQDSGYSRPFQGRGGDGWMR